MGDEYLLKTLRKIAGEGYVEYLNLPFFQGAKDAFFEERNMERTLVYSGRPYFEEVYKVLKKKEPHIYELW